MQAYKQMKVILIKYLNFATKKSTMHTMRIKTTTDEEKKKTT